MGKVVETISGGLINGPWDMTVQDLGNSAVLFVTNVLNGTLAASPNVVNQGTVVRVVLRFTKSVMPGVDSMTVIGSGFPERTDPAALVIGPTGVGLNNVGTLYVADSLDNRIAAIPNAPSRPSTANTGITISEGGGMNDPLGLVVGPLGNIVTLNGNDGLLVATHPNGTQFFKKLLDSTGAPPGAGTLFGLVFAEEGLYFVDDGTNTLNLLN
jgi:sugar lactone lactonase YvrE